MNYILKKALEMAAVLEKVSDFFLFKSNRILHLLGCLIGSALLGWEFGVGAGLTAEIKDMQIGGLARYCRRRYRYAGRRDRTFRNLQTLVGMAQHFTLSELLHSDTAEARGIQNTPPHDVLRRLNYLMDNCLDPIRRLWGKPIGVNSGYRSPAPHAAVGGVATSQHVKGEAADITTGTVEGNKQLFDMICASDISFDQLIDERNFRWLHISCKMGGIGNRRAILHL